MNRSRNRAVVSMATVLMTLAAGAVLETASAAHALAQIHVTNRADDGSFTSLRWAVAAASLDGGDVTIRLDGGAPYVIDRQCRHGDLDDNHGGDFDLITNANVTIIGPFGPLGPEATILVNCVGERAIHHLGTGQLNLTWIRVTGGNLPKGANGDQNGDLDAGNGQSGGAILSQGTVRLDRSTIDGNRGGDGGNGAPPKFGGRGGNGGHGGFGAAISALSFVAYDSQITNNIAGNGGNGANGVGNNVLNVGGDGGIGGSATIASFGANLVRTQVDGNSNGNGGNGGSGLGAGAAGGDGGAGGGGGGVQALGVTLDASTVEANAAGNGGPGGNGNGAPGGNGGDAGVGGGVSGLTATVVRSTVHGNSAGAFGPGGDGAPAGADGDLGFGGGIALSGGAGSSIVFSTITGNTAGAAANLRVPVQTTLSASVVGEPSGGGANCSNFVTSLGFNVMDSGSCGAGALDVVTVPLGLGPIGSNGGGTRTREPFAAGPLAERIPEDECETILAGDFTDQRSQIRPFARCEPGSVEIAPVEATRFMPLPPTRVFDTREAGAAAGYVFGGTTRTVQFAGVAGIPAVGATAVAFNLTIDAAAGAGYVSVNPTGHQANLTSSLNTIEAGQTVPNMVVVPLGGSGQLDFFAQTGGHLLADAVGYFVPVSQSHEGRIIPLSPARVFDTREPGVHHGKVAAGGTITVDVTDVAGVPASGVSAVVLNLTGTDADDAGYVTSYPGDQSLPLASTLNLESAGHTAANMTIVPVGADGTVSFYSQSGTHLLADVTGYVTDAAAALSAEGLFVPVTPDRVFDTREAGDALAPLGTIDIDTAGTHGIVPNASAVLLNVTATETAAAGYITGWPFGEEQPLASTLNVTRSGETRANAALLPIGDEGRISYFTQSGTHLLADVFGYLLPDPYVPLY